MTIRNWAVEKLGDAYAIELSGEYGLRVDRESRPPALIYCAETNGVGRFTADDLDAACRELPGVQFVLLVQRDAENQAYERAEEIGVCLSGFGQLTVALANDLNIAQHLTSGQKFLRRRLNNNQYVSSVRRCGRSAYEILRSGALTGLIIVTVDHYELTSDSVYDLLETNDGIALDAIVSINPACAGFAGEVVDAATQAGIRVLALNELLTMLGDTWT